MTCKALSNLCTVMMRRTSFGTRSAVVRNAFTSAQSHSTLFGFARFRRTSIALFRKMTVDPSIPPRSKSSSEGPEPTRWTESFANCASSRFLYLGAHIA